ncbi:MAG: pantoate--beta-alanine ligase [Terrisporobacter othiniensis]|uniref:pantoate--beta-alanine ligase n=1 Tax=Terrisporobacter petrolearius TaxID=1460447 RepID=UPI0022DFF5B6|nr:pantoate--beta-alanine ligase [Terrisporobacter petrolearius]MDU4861111.1 pantoate--beta-alanine ligase [Terrisporobacter othiniensis]MDU6994745.1 pantoate--beta-alanine ligase [Terrisporobacter othiniensis]
MVVIDTIDAIRKQVNEWKKEGLSVGLVPTMGYLHQGHQSLMEKAVEENDKVVVSIFVNPLQFGPKEDLAIYPRDFHRDKEICEYVGADLIFHPSADVMYNKDFSTSVNMSGLTDNLCGKSRPTHFIGVCTVVNKLFNIVTPDRAYFGQKDAQQLFIIKRMVRDLNINVEIVGCPIIREEDGLAKSSRNTYLSDNERKDATVLSKSLIKAKNLIKNGISNVDSVLNIIKETIECEPLAKIDYINIVDIDSLQNVDSIDRSVLVAIAVYINKTRLIDNFIYEV